MLRQALGWVNNRLMKKNLFIELCSIYLLVHSREKEKFVHVQEANSLEEKNNEFTFDGLFGHGRDFPTPYICYLLAPKPSSHSISASITL